MTRLIRLGVLVLIAAAAPWAGADPTDPVRWWRLDAGDLMHPGKGKAAIVCRTLDEAKAAVRIGDATKSAPPAWVEKVDYDAWMLVVVPCSGNEGSVFDVQTVTDDDGKLSIWCVRENNPDHNEKTHDTAMAVLLKKTDADVKADWSDDTMKALHAHRDCAGDHEDVKMLGSGCVHCGAPETPSPKCKLCGKCRTLLQLCGYCFKRLPGPPPLKK